MADLPGLLGPQQSGPAPQPQGMPNGLAGIVQTLSSLPPPVLAQILQTVMAQKQGGMQQGMPSPQGQPPSPAGLGMLAGR